ncbi:hypothetical protein V1264_011542 [Littorina saxatilis]|uniref:Mitochondrial assembly of ribosomal large subunit protein 1 n=2 Tax=Littorina saxatilis TaxID=31220 RepID=A0AAN9GKE1_9CAEN
MNQIAQDFEKGKEPFQISNPEQNVTLSSVSNVDQLDVNMTVGESSNHIQIEDFGYIEDDEEEYEEVVPERHVPISLDRRQQGVFDVEEMVTVLEHENGIDIQVIDIPPEVCFVDHMVIVSGKSLRHMRAMAASIEWLYKQKKRKRDRPFKLEGRDCKDWFAMDLGNIAVHIFTTEARQHYDIETLWTLGPEHDDRRHYVEDDQLNLSAADLFWLETGMNQTPASQVALDSDEKRTGNAVQDRSESEQVTGPQNRNGKELQGKTSGKSDSGV